MQLVKIPVEGIGTGKDKKLLTTEKGEEKCSHTTRMAPSFTWLLYNTIQFSFGHKRMIRVLFSMRQILLFSGCNTKDHSLVNIYPNNNQYYSTDQCLPPTHAHDGWFGWVWLTRMLWVLFGSWRSSKYQVFWRTSVLEVFAFSSSVDYYTVHSLTNIAHQRLRLYRNRLMLLSWGKKKPRPRVRRITVSTVVTKVGK